MYTFRGSLAPSSTVRRIRTWATAVSLYLEAFLCHLHTLLYFFFLHTYEPASRAWWDSSKGSAVVIYAPHNDAVARYVALRLSSGSPSSFALKDVGPTKRNPRAPYTCFVLHADSDQFSITVAQWAAKKARIEKALLKQKAGRSSESSSLPSSPTSTTHTFDGESTADRSEPSSPSPTPSAQLGPRGDETPRASSASRKSRPPPIQINRRRRRSRSWSAWATPDLFGYGIDMLKGWMPGRSGPKATPAGTIIPIMADVQTADGLAMINSTISAYCNSHDLLLSGVILIPSVLCPRNVPLTKAARADMPKTPGSAYSDVDPFSLHNRDVWGEVRAASGSTGRSGAGLTGPRDPFGLAPAWREADLGASVDSSSFNAASPPLSPTSARIVRTQDDQQAALHSALATDVVQAKALINVLFPALKRDKGRILGLVPSGYGPELPHDPDTLSLQSLPSRNGSGKARDRSHSGSSSADLTPEREAMPVLKTWPGAVVNTVREALRTQYREMELEYKRRGGSAKHVHVSTIETNALVRLPQTRLKKMVKWNESVRFFNTRKRSAWRWRDLFYPARLLDRLPFIARFGRLRGDDSHASPDAARYGIYIPAELRPFLRGWVRPLTEARDEDDIHSTAPALVRLARRLVRALRWIEQCSMPWDDLSEHVAAVSYPIALGSSCPPTPGPSQSLLHSYTVSSNHAPSAHRQLWSGTSKKVDDDEDAADFPFSTASSGPAVTLLNVKAEPVRVPRTYPRELSHQNPTPLFESIRSALTSYHPRRTYYPTLAGWTAAVIHDATPWVHEWIKPALAAYLLQYTVETQP